jgi:isopenicillin N synthase-like dioxygenase
MKTETGAPDRCEFFNVSQDDLLGNSTPHRATPAPVESRRGLLRSYLEHGQFALTHILRALATQLNLPPATFRDLQPLSRPSGTILRMIRYPPSLTPAEMRTGLLPHTDFGSVTLLANVVGGLQVLAPDSQPEDEQAWQWVRPRPGCLIVNMADAMVQWTGGILRSNMHRVNYAPGEQRHVARFSVAMLVRPYKEATMRRLNGGRIPSVEDDEREGLATTEDNISTLTAHEWELKKAMMLKEGKDCARSRGGRELKPLIAV